MRMHDANWLQRSLTVSSGPRAYCPVCSHLLPLDAKRCSVCSADVDKWNKADFTGKLIGALLHPIADIRMRAIIVLGNRREALAETPLVEYTLTHPADLVEGLAVVNSLRLIQQHTKSNAALRAIADGHPGAAVRNAAQDMLSS